MAIFTIKSKAIKNGEKTVTKLRKKSVLKLFNEAIFPVPKNAISTNATKINARRHSIKVNFVNSFNELPKIIYVKKQINFKI